MSRRQVFVLAFGLGSLLPAAIDVVFGHWYWNHFYAKGL